MMKRYSTVNFVLTIIFGLILQACGGSSGGNNSSTSSFTEGGVYRVVLKNINSQISGNNAFGTGSIRINNETLQLKVSVIDSHAGVSHLQTISNGAACPGDGVGDANGDGLIDAQEGAALYGEPMVFLDGDLTSQDPVGAIYPRANGAGNYTYEKTVDLAKMVESLHGEANFEGKTLVIHGVRSGTIPATVAGAPDSSPEASLPVACGIIMKIHPED